MTGVTSVQMMHIIQEIGEPEDDGQTLFQHGPQLGTLGR